MRGTYKVHNTAWTREGKEERDDKIEEEEVEGRWRRTTGPGGATGSKGVQYSNVVVYLPNLGVQFINIITKWCGAFFSQAHWFGDLLQNLVI